MAGGTNSTGGSTTVDASTTFTGPITIQASTFDEIVARLEARRRVTKITRATRSTAGDGA